MTPVRRRTALSLGLLPFLPAATRAAAAATVAPLPITIGMQTIPDWSLIAARHFGLLEKAGLKPSYLRFTAGAPMLAAIESRSVDLITLSLVPFIAGLAQGIPLVCIGFNSNTPDGEGLVVRRGSGIKTLADLRGKRIGYYRASTAHYGLLMALKKANIPLDDVHLLSLAPAAQVAAMRNGEIGAAEVWEPWIQKLIHQGHGRLLAMEDHFGVDTAFGVYAVRRDWLAAHRETARRFLRAVLMGYANVTTNPAPTITIFAKNTGIAPVWARAVYADSPPFDPHKWIEPGAHYSLTPGGTIAKTALEPLMRFLVAQRVIPHPIDFHDVLDGSVLREVLTATPTTRPTITPATKTRG